MSFMCLSSVLRIIQLQENLDSFKILSMIRDTVNMPPHLYGSMSYIEKLTTIVDKQRSDVIATVFTTSRAGSGRV